MHVKVGAGNADAASCVVFQTERGPGHVAPADNHITTAQVHLTRDLFPDAAGGAGYLLVRRTVIAARTLCTNTSLTGAMHSHVTHQRHPPRQICTRCRVHHHRGKHCHPQCSLSSWHHHHAPGNPRSTAILFPEEPVPARSTTHCHCGSHTVHRHVTHRRSGRTSTQSVRIICKPKTSSVDCCAGQGAAFADLKQTNAGISAQTAALLSAQAAALRSVQRARSFIDAGERCGMCRKRAALALRSGCVCPSQSECKPAQRW